MSEPENWQIVVTDVANESDRESVEAGLVAFNATRSPYHAAAGDPGQAAQPLDVLLRDADGTLLGGIICVTFWSWLSIELVWLDERARAQGYGSRMLQMAEDEARRRGCTRSRVTTYSFQARGFYEKHGYRVVGQLDDFPPGGAHYTLRKDFTV